MIRFVLFDASPLAATLYATLHCHAAAMLPAAASVYTALRRHFHAITIIDMLYFAAALRLRHFMPLMPLFR